MSGQKINMAMYVDGLHAMQSYLAMRNEQIEIPVGRVVSIADMTLHYIFSVPCADRAEYDALVYRQVGRDRQLAVITLIVLAAMLRRADGPQARMCRAVLMEDRDEDFYDGVSLYERFLRSSAPTFPQESFETDIMDELLALRQENMQLKHTISYMENTTRHIGYNVENMVINMTGGTLVQHADLVQASGEVRVSQCESVDLTEQPVLFCRITALARAEGKAQIVENELRSACVSAPKLLKAIRTNEALGYLDTQNLSSTELFDLLNQHFSLSFKLRTFQDYRSR